MSEIAEKVKAIIIDKLGVEASEVTPEASFTNDLGADSLDTVELIMEFEKEFNVSTGSANQLSRLLSPLAPVLPCLETPRRAFPEPPNQV